MNFKKSLFILLFGLVSCGPTPYGDGERTYDFNDDGVKDVIEFETSSKGTDISINYGNNSKVIYNVAPSRSIMHTEIADFNDDNKPDIGVITCDKYRGPQMFNQRIILYNKGRDFDGVIFSLREDN